MNIYKRRRTKLLEAIDEGTIIIKAAHQAVRSSDTHYKFRQDSHFFYLTGIVQPDAVLCCVDAVWTLFLPQANTHHARWENPLCSPQTAIEISAIENICFIQDYRQYIHTINHAYSNIEYIPEIENICLIEEYIAPLRLIKDAHEIECMRHAALISSHAHNAALEIIQADMYEYEISALLEYHFAKKGADVAYQTIVAGGKNGCILHYTHNRDKLKQGELVLIDAGCEFKGYASDITRTFPVNRTYTSQQAAIYDLVLDAQVAAIEVMQAGNKCSLYHHKAVEIIASGLKDLGLLKGSIEEILETQSYKRFFMHSTGHFIGLDVHDVGGRVASEGVEETLLKSDMVLTVEPGIYIGEEEDIPSQWHNIAVRIEDDIRITHQGQENLSILAIKNRKDIEINKRFV